MGNAREYLHIGTRIFFDSGSVYEISGEPIGCGGGSIIYPAVRLSCRDGNMQTDGFSYALKECYPVSAEHSYVRSQSGEIVPETPNEAELFYFERVKQMQLAEQRVTKEIYRTASRMLPICEAAEEIQLKYPEREPVRVRNTVTVMESLGAKGRSLTSYLQEYRQIPVLQAFHIVQQLLFSLREIHQAGFLHLDVQDGNIFVKGTLEDQSDIVTLIDFGSARPLRDGKTDAIEDCVIFTTRGFSAPEILLHNDGTLRLGPEADLFSVGCLLLYLLTGSKYDVRSLIGNTSGIYLTRFKLRKIDCPKHLVDRMQKILAHALETEPENRYHSADEMLADVSEFIKVLQPRRPDLDAAVYDAFVCYRHGPVDSKAAVLIQQKLEHFRAPRGTAKRRKPFQRVFVDEGELSSCADFGEQIRSALKNSEWLIVVCSPDTPHSPWVQEEIAIFLEYHDRSRILAVLTAGEPEESFPKQLLGQNGYSEAVLAADARGKNEKEVLAKLRKDVLLKIAAPMLGTTYDTLKQRRKIYLFQRAAAAAVLGLIAAIAFSGYAVTQNRRIDTEYQKTLVHQSQYLAALAQEQLDSNNPMEAIELALSALPADEQDRPVVASAEYVLTRALNVYRTPNDASSAVAATGAFQHQNNIAKYDYFADYDSDRLFTSDGERIYIWSIADCAVVHTIPLDNTPTLFREELLDADKDQLIYSDSQGIFCYDYKQMEIQWTCRADSVKGALINGDSVFFVTEGKITELDRETGKELASVPFSVAHSSVSCDDMAVSQDGTRLAFDLHDDSNNPPDDLGELEYDDWYEEKTYDVVVVADLTGRTVTTVRPEIGDISVLKFSESDSLVLVSQCGYDLNYEGLNGTRGGISRSNSVTAMRYSLDDSNAVWKQSFPYGAITGEPNAKLVAADTGNCVVLSYSNKAAQISLDDGTILGEWEMTDKIIDLWSGKDGTGFYAATRDGSIQQVLFGEKHWYRSDLFPDGIDRFSFGNGLMLIESNSGLFEESTIITKYEYASDENWHSISDDLDVSLLGSPKFYSSDGTAAFLDDGYDDKTLILYSPEDDSAQRVPLKFESGCGIQVDEILGVYDLSGRSTLMLSGKDTLCEKHEQNCAICVDTETLEQTILYIPLPEETLTRYLYQFDEDTGELISEGYVTETEEVSISAVSYAGDTAYFVADDVSDDENGAYYNLFVYSWKIGEKEAKKLCSYQELTEENGDYHVIQEIIPDSDGQNMVIAAASSQDDGKYSYRLFCVNGKNGTVKPIWDQSCTGEYEAETRIHWSQDGSRFSFVSSDDVQVYDKTGALNCSIPCDSETRTVIDLSFVPESDEILLMTSDGMLTKYSLRDGTENCSADVNDIFFIYSQPENDELSWEYCDDGHLILSGSSHSIVIDIDDTTWGICTMVQDSIGYDAEYDRFYIYENDLSEPASLGYFQRYSLDELIELGNRIVGNKD